MHESAAKAAPVSLLFRERLRLHAARQIDRMSSSKIDCTFYMMCRGNRGNFA